MAYSEKVIDHYENPRNVGSLNKNDANVGTGLVGAPACGDVMKLQVRKEEREGEREGEGGRGRTHQNRGGLMFFPLLRSALTTMV